MTKQVFRRPFEVRVGCHYQTLDLVEVNLISQNRQCSVEIAVFSSSTVTNSVEKLCWPSPNIDLETK